MREIELKLLLNADQVARLRRDPALKRLGQGVARTAVLRSHYYDTEDRDLRAAGIALRLRRVDGQWIQTVKKATDPIEGGLSQPLERECVVPRQALALGQILDDDLREEVIGLARPGLIEVAQTRFRRTQRMMNSPLGGLVELAIDVGHVSAGDRKAELVEVELELKQGHAGDLYALAEVLFRRGPIVFSDISKSGRAAMLAETGEAYPRLQRRKAVPVAVTEEATVEQAARLILREGLTHATANLPLLLQDNSVDGPHQLRVGLRRLRSALGAFRRVMDRGAVAGLNDTARMMASEAGRLRDLDVLADDLVAPMAERSPDDAGFARLMNAIAARREAVRAEVREALAAPEATAFGFRMGGFLAARGWLDPADHDQTRRLGQPIGPFARKILNRRWKVVSAYGARIEDLSIEERHEMRKEVKKLRYLVDAFRGLYDPEQVAAFTRAVKRLQKAFGALNDSAMAEMMLLTADAPAHDDPAAQRAAGVVLGHLAAQSDMLWPEAVAGWQLLSEPKPFWR